MENLTSPQDLRERVRAERAAGKTIGLVPTMGYLHEGHMSLLRLARSECDFLVMSLFVNPTQFAAGEGLKRYPRDVEGDTVKAEAGHVDLIFAPDVGAMYPEGYQTKITLERLSQGLCGVSRPEHFSGVATVVCKLFNAADPDVAVFGEKDYQQLAIIRQMAADLDFGVRIIGAPIVRENDGLAMSSRNVYLNADEREQATCLHKGLQAAKQRFDEGVIDASTLLSAARAVIAGAPKARIDYLELRDARTLEEVEHVEGPALMATAAHFGTTRLIDNLLF